MALKVLPMAGRDSNAKTKGMVNKQERRVVTACSLAGSKLVRCLKSLGKFLRRMERMAKATLDPIASLAALVVKSLDYMVI